MNPFTQVAKAGIEGFKYTSKTAKPFKKSVKVADKLGDIPGILEDILTGIKSFKIIKGIIKAPKLYKKSQKLFKQEKPYNKFLTIYGFASGIKKIVGAIATALYYAKKFGVVTKRALAWTAITDIIFLPFAFAKAGIAIETLREKSKHLKDFKDITDFKGHATVEAAKQICQRILEKPEQKRLLKAKVITKDSNVKDRFKGVLKKLEQNDTEAVKEAQFLITAIRNRITEQVGLQGVKTALTVAKVGLIFIPLAAIPAAITGLVLAAIKFGAFGYSKVLPNGDIHDTEKRLLFARIADLFSRPTAATS